MEHTHENQGWPAWPQALLCGGVAASHVGTIALARHISRTTTEGVPLWAAAGVTLAVLLLTPRRLWPGVLLTTFTANVISNLVIDVEVDTSVVSAASNSLEPLLGALLVLGVLGTSPDLSQRRHLLVYLGGAVVVGPAVGALVGAGSTQLSPDSLPFFDVAGRWYTGDALGVLVVGSFILAWANWRTTPRGAMHGGLEAAATVGLVIGCTVLAFWGSSPVLAYVVLPPLAWASIRFGVRGATLGGLVVAVIADWATIEDHGLFAFLSDEENNEALWQLQLFLAVVLVTALVLAAHVSELGEAERALRNAEEQQRVSALLESSPDPVVVLRPDGTVDYANEQLVALTGRSREELIGRPWINLLPPSHRARVGEVIGAVLDQPAGSRSTFEMEGLGELLDRSLETAVIPFDTVGGRVLVATIRDVTDRKATEAALRVALDEAEAATEAKTQFLATMSHEIRTPMAAVISLIELLGHTPLDAEQQSLLHTMRSSSDALLRIIDDTLDFSKIEAGMMEFEALPVAIDDEVRTVASLMEPAAATKGISLVCTTQPPEPAIVVGDPVRIRQVLLNLVGNAIKFTSDGGVELRAVVTEGESGGTDVSFTVRDTGIGIDEDQQAELFRPFTQAEHSTTRLYGGTGLGLSIVSRLLKLMDGDVEVSSVPGEGSTFVVRLRLPLAPEGAALARRRPVRRTTGTVDVESFGGHVVLVVEDNAVNRDVVRRQLALIGCAADVAADGQEALDRLAGGGISLVLTDCHMPVLDGFELTRAIRAGERAHAEGDGSRIPVVAITANAMDGEGDRCMAAGMDAYLTKPVEVARLAATIADLLPDAPLRPPVPIDLGVLRAIVGDDDDAVMSVLDTCISSLREQADVVEAALDAGDRSQVGGAAHRIVGAAASVGASRLASLARTVEQGATTADVEVLRASARWVRSELDVVAAQISQLESARG